MNTIQTDDFIFQDINKTAKAYACFVDKELCLSVTNGDNQFDFNVSPDMLKVLTYAYQLHCENYNNVHEDER